MADDKTYYLQRASEERFAAAAADSEAARKAHAELAWRYRQLAGPVNNVHPIARKPMHGAAPALNDGANNLNEPGDSLLAR